jgi:hypothetical protein
MRMAFREALGLGGHNVQCVKIDISIPGLVEAKYSRLYLTTRSVMSTQA